MSWDITTNARSTILGGWMDWCTLNQNEIELGVIGTHVGRMHLKSLVNLKNWRIGAYIRHLGDADVTLIGEWGWDTAPSRQHASILNFEERIIL